jgi:hypothetical protein
MPDARAIAMIHLTLRADDGAILAVVTYTTGRLGITRNGVPIPDLDFPLDQKDACIAALLSLRAAE